jgi:predicted dehydrogenase
MRHLKLALVGCGDIAGFTALVSKGVRTVSLCACCDVNAARAESFAKRYGIPRTFTDYAELLEKGKPDAVYLAVPHNLHAGMIRLAVQAGLPVLVEKPLTRTLEEGRQLAADLVGAKIGVNYQHRYDAGCYGLARAVQSGQLGKVHSARINVPWHREANYFEKAGWHKSIAQAGGGTLITQGSHFLDAVLWALGERPVSAMGYVATPGFDVEVDTLAHGIVETEGGTLISITSTMAAAREDAVTMEIYGERATAYYTSKPRERVRFSDPTLRAERPPERGVHALQRSLAAFTRWVLEDVPYLTPAASALPVLAAVDGIYRSACSGVREKIEK